MSIEKLDDAIKNYQGKTVPVEEASPVDDWFMNIVKNAPDPKPVKSKPRRSRAYIRWAMPEKKQSAAGKLYKALKSIKGMNPNNVSINPPNHEGIYAGGQITGSVVFPVGSKLTDASAKQAMSIIKRFRAKVLEADLATLREEEDDLSAKSLTAADRKSLAKIKASSRPDDSFSLGSARRDSHGSFYYISISKSGGVGQVFMLRSYSRRSLENRARQAIAFLSK